MRWKYRITSTVNIVKPNTETDGTIDYGLDPTGAVNMPLVVDQLSAQFLNTKDISKSTGRVLRHEWACVICPSSCCRGDGHKLGGCQPPVFEATFNIVFGFND
jgi:hypothetical protein